MDYFKFKILKASDFKYFVKNWRFKNFKNYLGNILVIFLGALLLTWPALAIQSPLMEKDSWGYIGKAFYSLAELNMRSIFYPFFIWYGTLRGTTSLLWLVLLQGLITSSVIFILFRVTLTENFRKVKFLLSILTLSTISSLAWLNSEIMADFMTPMLCLTSYLIVNHWKNLRNFEKIWISLVLVQSALFHHSHLPTILLVLAIVFIFRKFFSPRDSNWIPIASLAILTCFIFGIAENNKRDQLVSSGPIFLFGRMVLSGRISEVLNEQCAKKNYKLCASKDAIDFAWRFEVNYLWKITNTFEATGGWYKSDHESTALILESFTSHPFKNFSDLLTLTFKQLITFKVLARYYCRIDNDIFDPLDWIAEKFEDRHPNIQQSLHNAATNEGCKLTVIEKTEPLRTAFGYLTLAILLFFSTFSVLKKKPNKMSIFFSLFIISNALICGFFAGVYDRYQARVMPLAGLFVLLLLWQWLNQLNYNRREPKVDNHGLF